MSSQTRREFHRRITDLWPTLGCAALLLSACHGHDTERAKREFGAIQTKLRAGQLAPALSLSSAGARRWEDRRASDVYIRFKLLEAEVLIYQGRPPLAQSILQALRISSEPSSFEVERQTLLGVALLGLGKEREAEQALNAAYGVAGAQKPDEPLVKVLIAKGLFFSAQKRFGESENVFRSALKLATELNDRNDLTAVYLDLGLIRSRRSRHDEAIPYFEQSQAAAHAAGALQVESVALFNLAICHERLGDFDRARLLVQQAISIQQKIGANNSLANSYGELGNMYFLERDLVRAVPNYERAVQLAQDLKSDKLAGIWSQNLASAYIEMPDWDKANRMNQQASAIASRLGQRSSSFLQLNSAAIEAGRGNRNEALRLYQEVLASADGTAPSLTWEAHAGLAHLYGEAHEQENASRHFESALLAIEQARSGLSRADYKITFLTQLIRFYQEFVDLLIEQGDIRKALAVADSSRARILAERLHAKEDVDAAPARDFEAVAKWSRSVLVSYWISPKRTVAWVITPKETRLVALPESGVRIQELVKSYSTEIEQGMRDPAQNGSAAGSKLYQALVQPIERFVPAGTRVIVIPDGPLYNLNFETLLAPAPQPHYWIEDVSLSVAPSLALLAEMPVKTTAGRGALLIGNPEPVEQYTRLPSAEREIAAIQQHFPSSATKVLTKSQATPAAYQAMHPEQFSLIHFTAHAEANSQSPLDSAVILSRVDDREYKLYGRDLLDTRLKADLVTVSACTSAGVKAYSGEGLVGFAWAFLHSGAKNVIAGLWDADDKSTTRLMDHMYGRLAAGSSPDGALRDAKLELIRSGGVNRKPYYWASLQVYRRTAR